MPQSKKVSELDAVGVRLATVDDAPEIANVLREAFGAIREYYTDAAFDAVTPGSAEIEQRFGEGPIWVAELDGRIIGTVSLTTEDNSYYVRSMAVLPEGQGRGVGRELLRALHAHVAGGQFERIFLYTLPFQKGARAMYEKYGYKWVRDTPADEWFGVPGLEMEMLIGKENVA